MLDKLGESNPSSGVHVYVTLVLNQFLVNAISMYSFGTKSNVNRSALVYTFVALLSKKESDSLPPRKQLDEIVLELHRVTVNV